MTAIVSFERVFEVLDLEPLITERPDAVAMPDGPVSVSFDGVRFATPAPSGCRWPRWRRWPPSTRGGTEVLHDVSFRVEPGRMVALVGTSGSGKSTIAALAPRLYDVDAGAVRLGGIDVRDLSFEAIRSTLGLVTQDGHLFHDTGAGEPALRPARGDRRRAVGRPAHGPAGAADRVAARRARQVGERGYRFSGGERQRLTIARLLLPAPGRHPRRGHRPPRLHLRGGGPGGAGRRAGGTDVHRHRPPPVHRAGGRPSS